MQPVQSGRGARLAVVALSLLALLAVVAFASRSGFGHASKASPSPDFVGYAFTVFLIVFVLAIPLTIYAYVLSAREEGPRTQSFRDRVIRNLVTFGILLAAAAAIWTARRHAHFHIGGSGLGKSIAHLQHPQAHRRTQYEPKFEWPVLFVALPLLAATAAAYLVHRSRRPRYTPTEMPESVTDDLLATIGLTIDDLEAEPDARRAVIAAYARMEGVLARHGLRRQPSETPLEYLRRVLLDLTSRGPAVERLTALFERAKFSLHEIDASMKQEAIGALREIRDDLQGEPA